MSSTSESAGTTPDGATKFTLEHMGNMGLLLKDVDDHRSDEQVVQDTRRYFERVADYNEAGDDARTTGFTRRQWSLMKSLYSSRALDI